MSVVNRGLMIIGGGVLFAQLSCGSDPVAPLESSTETLLCDQPGEQRCDEDNNVYACRDGMWQTYGKLEQWECDCIEVDWQGCPVPGFVGIARAGAGRSSARGIRVGVDAPLPFLV